MFNDPALTTMANHISGLITHLQLYSAATDAAGTLNAVGARQPTSGKVTVDTDGDITWANVAFTGLAANQAVAAVGYFTALTGGTFYGSQALTGDTAANAAGEFNITSLVENGTSSTA